MQAVQYLKSVPRWAVVKTLGHWMPSVVTGPFGMVGMRAIAEPRLPGPRWARVATSLSGICGSDLASITAENSPFFSPLISFPFTLGHEAVGRVTEVGSAVTGVRVGDRVVVEPALHCMVRGIERLCMACERGDYGNCVNVTVGDIAPGIQTGYCRDTGGGWSANFVAHEVQLHKIPDNVADDAAVMIEPFSCALHAVLLAASTHDASRSTPLTLVFGCGTIGLLTIAALRLLEIPARIFAVAKHRHQQEMARKLGADEIVPTGKKTREAFLHATGATIHWPEMGGPTVLGGFDNVYCCVGSARAVDECIRFTRARGATVLVGMPAFAPKLDWTSIWFKENRVLGAYAYGMERHQGRSIKTFQLALEFVRDGKIDLASFVTHKYSLDRYREAVQTALFTGRHGSIKTAFDLTQ